MQLIFRYGFFRYRHIPLALENWQFNLLVLSTVLIAAGGYVINNIFDQETDLVNNPQKLIVGISISETQAHTIYLALTSSGVALGFYLANVIAKPSFAAIFIIIAATLYLYATSLKQMLLIGNFVIALLLACSVIIVGVFDLFPATTTANKQQMGLFFSILIDFAIFAFIINLLREIVKDIEDYDGDKKEGMNTFPIFVGKEKAAKIVGGLSLIPLLLILYYLHHYLLDLQFVTFYMLLFVCVPLLLFTVKIWNATSQNEFHYLSQLLKGILFFGILSIVVINYNITYNA